MTTQALRTRLPHGRTPLRRRAAPQGSAATAGRGGPGARWRRGVLVAALALAALLPILLVERLLGLGSRELAGGALAAWLLLAAVARGAIARGALERIGRRKPRRDERMTSRRGLDAGSRTRAAVLLAARGEGTDEISVLLQGLQTDPARSLVVFCPAPGQGPGESAAVQRLRAECRVRGIRCLTLAGSGEGLWAADGSRLVQVAPWIADADLFASGPDEWLDAVHEQAARYGVAPAQIHLATPTPAPVGLGLAA